MTANTLRAPDRSPRRPQQGYRADIDGLRAVAVLSVVGYHAYPHVVTGGFVGVDIFFVISGFLISTLIYGGLGHGSFSFANFYSRRIRRIFPAVLLVLGACLAFGWFTLLADEYRQLGKHVAGGAGFVSNFVLWGESGYFDNEAATKPLLHLWSLGIEEQFYIVWPLLLWLAWKSRVSLLALAVTVATLSLLLNLATYRSDTIGDFYSPQTRFWELLAGSVLAYVTLNRAEFNWPDGRGAREVLSALGAACITAAIFLVSADRPFPGAWAVLPVLGAVMVIAAGPHAWLNRAVLSKPLLVWFGLISFPLYAWHWPLLSFARIVGGETPGAGLRAAAVVVSIALAWVTYRLVERPVRFGGHAALKTTALVVLMSLVGTAGYSAYRADGLESRAFARLYRHIGEARTDWKYPGGLTRMEQQGISYFASSTQPASVLALGDSHLEQFGPRVAHLAARGAIPPTLFLTGGGCPAVPAVYDDQHPWCRDLIQRFERLLHSSPQARTVLISGCWNCYFIEGATGDPGPGRNPNYYYEENGVKASFRADNGKALALASLGRFLKNLAKTHSVFLLLDNPAGAFFDPGTMLSNRLSSSPDRVFSESTPPPADQVALNERLRSIAIAAGAQVIDQLPVICPNGLCVRFDVDGRPIYRDASHLRARFVSESADYLDIVWRR